jgi:TP901 family phage tail tape measure protein
LADAESRINLNIDATQAMATIKSLQSQISAFHQQLRATGDAASRLTSTNNSKNLVNSINATKQFSASFENVSSAANTFTTALERNKLSMGEYFKYGVAASGKFGNAFRSEWSTIDQVARERVKSLQTQFIRLGKDANGAIETIRVRPLRLDLNNLQTQVMMNNQKQQIFNQLLKQGSTQLLNFGKNTQWAGRQLMVGFTIPLSILGGTAIKSFQEMEEAVIKFKRVYGELNTTVAQTDAMIKDIEQLAKSFTKYGVAIKDTMEMAAEAAAMGKMGADLTAQVANATKLAVLGGVEQSQALQTTISLQNALGVSTEELASKIDFLNAVENQTVVSIEDLTIAVPKAGPVVRQLGGDVEDLAFFLTAMKEGGINASEGANALKSGLASLINPTKQSTQMLAGLGININAIVEGNAGDIKGTVIGFANALDTLDPLNRARAIEQLFGKFQFSRISTLFQNIVTEGTQASRVLDLTRASAAELAILSERELKRVEDSPAFKFQKALEDIKKELVPLGLEFIKLITPIINFAKGMLEQFNNMDSGVKTFVTGLIAVLGLIAPVALMTFGLFANGIANLIKGFGLINTMFGRIAGVSSNAAGAMDYFTQQQLEAAAVASSLNQVHSNLTQTFSLEKGAIDSLTLSYRNAASAMQQYNVVAQPRIRPGVGTTPPSGSRGTGPATKPPPGFKDGVLSLPGPRGAGDIIPAMLAPGEAVIPAKKAQKYRGFIQQMIAGKLPEFSKGFLGMPKSAKTVTKNRAAADAIYQNFLNSKYRNTPPTNYGHQLSPTSGHSFPIFGLGGVYTTPSGKKVFVKPMVNEQAAVAEMQGTQIARQAHGLKAPQQRIVVIRDPQDVTRKRRFLALESDLDPTFMNTDNKAVFNEEQYFRQLVASLVRADKDLAAGNMFGDVVADVGPAGVFSRASGERSYTTDLPSMEEQATINLLGVRGGAKRAFAESTVGLMAGLTPERYHQKMISEIDRVLPSLRQTIAGFNLTDPTEVDAYNAMISRLQTGRNVDWRKFHAMHSNVQIKTKPSQAAIPKYADGVISVPGPKGAGDVVPAMLSPGEAVIPADKASKYRGFIQQMIAGNIPGLFEGTSGAGLSFPKLDQKATATVLQEAQTYSALGQQEAAVAKQALEALSKQKTQSLKDWRRILALSGVEAGQGSQNQILNKALMETYPDSKARKSQFKGFRGSQAGEANKLIPKYGLEQEAAVASTVSRGAYESLVSQGTSPDDAFRMTQYNPDRPGSGVALGHKVDVGSGKLLPEGWQKEFVGADPYFENSVLTSMTGTDKGSTTKVFEAYESAAAVLMEKKVVAEEEWRSLESAILGDQSFTEAQRKTFAKVNKEVADTNTLDPNVTMRAKALDQGYSDADIQNISGYRVQSSKEDIVAAGQKLNEAKKAKLGGEEIITPEQKAKIEQDGQNLIDGLLNAIDEAAKMRSPSREMYERGKNLVRGMINGVEQQYQESTGQNLNAPSSLPAPPPIPGFEDQVAGPTYVDPDVAKGQGIGKRFAGKAEKFLENQIMGDGAFSKTNMGQNLRSAFETNMGSMDDQLGYIEGETQLERSKRELLQQRQNVIAAETGNLLQTAAQLTEEGILNDEEAINIRNENGSLKTRRQLIEEEEALAARKAQQSKEDSKAARKEERSIKNEAAATKRQSRAGKALGALGTVTMVAGMASGIDGPVGEVARGILPVAGALTGILPILMALPLPLALLAAGLGAVAFGIFKMNEAVDKSREAGRKLGDALTLSTDKLIKFSEATGRVSATEERRQQQVDQITGTTAGQRAFGMTFLESDAGKGLLDQINTLASSGLNAEQSAESIGRQLAMMVLQGVLTASEANSIVAAVGLEIDDQAFSAEIGGELVSLIGPNGEDITKDPLKVAIEIQEAGAQQFEDLTGIVDNIINTDYSTADFIQQFGTDEARAEFDKLSDGVIEEMDKITDRSERFAEGGFTGWVAGLEGMWADITNDEKAFGFIDLPAAGNDFNIAQDYLDEYGEAIKDFTALQSASIQVGIGQLQENQQLLDAFQKQMTVKEDQLKADIAQEQNAEKKRKLEGELLLLQQQRSSGIEELNARNAQNLNDLIAMRDMYTDSGAWGEAIKATVLAGFADDDPFRVLAENTLNQLAKVEDKELRSTLELGLAGKEVDITTIQSLLEIGDDGTVTINAAFKLAVERKGFADANQIQGMLGGLGLDSASEGLVLQTITGIGDPEQFEQFKQALAELSQFEGEYNFDFNFESGDDVLGVLSKVSYAMDDLESKPDELTFKMLTDANTTGQYDAILANWNGLVGQDNVMTKTMIFEFIAAISGGDEALINWYIQSQGMAGLPRQMAIDLLGGIKALPGLAATELIGGGKTVIEEEIPPKTPTPQGGSKQDPLEATLRRLKEIRDGAIDATGGLKELKKVIGSGSGTKLKIFDGLENQLLTMGQGGAFTDWLLGLEESARKTFAKIAKDGTITLTAAGKRMAAAFNEITIGEAFLNIQKETKALEDQQKAYEKLRDAGMDAKQALELASDATLAAAINSKQFSTQELKAFIEETENLTAAQKEYNNALAVTNTLIDKENTVEELTNQSIAIQKLTADGVELAQAFEIVKDAALAAAIAAGDISDEDWQTLIDTINQATEATKQFSAAQNLANSNASFAQQQEILQWILDNEKLLSGELINEILNNTDLQNLILAGPDLTAEQLAVLEDFLNNFLNESDLELSVKKLTIEGMEEIFNDGFSKAMEAFAAEEKAIELEYEVKLADDNKLVEDAQNQIAAIDFEIDDLEAQLVGIEDQEEKINEKYDEKLEALEEIKSVNEQISREQRSQLTIADALTRGDISAAAAAVQELRAQNAQASIDNQQKLLEKSRELELDRIVSESGKTRKQLEEEIKKLKDEIFLIEEKTLEPAQERVRLAEIEKQQRIDDITILGRTRLEWEQIQNGIDLAKTRSDIYADAMQAALDIVKDIENYWNNLNRTISTVHEIINVVKGPGGNEATDGGSAGGSGFATDNTAKGRGITYTDLGDGTGQASTEFGASTPVQLGPGRTISTGDVEYRALRGESLQDVANRLGIDVSRLRVADMREGNRNGEFLFNNQLVYASPLTMASGGMVPKYLRMGGMLPYKAEGGSIFKPLGTDTIPAMLSPGEFVVRKFAVDNFGVDRLKAINSGTYSDGSVYNYSVNVNVKSDANPDQIARAVMTQIKQIDSQRIRSNRF